ncbi:signal peptide peptidase SppA [candidate division CSSED10-310 bacterium]|uniref:Signal peptide peptidase SppA n=1 Tax=candidate division CSSED10-310 bacterium TaxID=2855610 RepID=A0ABV6YWW0_UNCC1
MKKGTSIMVGILILCFIASMVGIFQLFKAKTNKPVPLLNKDLNFFGATSKKGPGIGVVRVYGPIMTEAESYFAGFQERGCDSIVKKLDKFRKDDRVRAVVLRVNSPGGSIGASQEITEAVRRLKDDGKKVIVSMGDIAASGGYYISALADKIVANRGTITGSIGVISAGLNLTGLMEKHGVKMNVVKQGKNKDIFAYWRDMTAEERTILEELSKNVYEQFLEVVSKGRNIPKNELLPIADGKIITGEQALKLRLVDELGGFLKAVTIAANEVGLDPENPNLITSTEVGFQKLFELIGQESMSQRSMNFQQMLMSNPLPVLYYCAYSIPAPYITMMQ